MTVELRNGSEVDRAEWREMLAGSPQAAIYALPGYMDIVAPGWQALELRKGDELRAIMPVKISRKARFHAALQPAFAQYWGIFFRGSSRKAYKQLSEERKAIKALIEAIPSEVKWFNYNFAPEFGYALPFHWAGYQLHTRYTYQLMLDAPEEELLAGFGYDTRYDIRKASSLEAGIQSAQGADGLMKLIELNAQQGKTLLSAEQTPVLQKLAEYLINENLGFLLESKDEKGQVICAGLFGHFAGKTVYLMSARQPEAPAGAMTLLIWKAIRMAREHSRIFDFEGSMMEDIEGFFRGFGGRPVPYLNIEKNDLPLLLQWIRSLR